MYKILHIPTASIDISPYYGAYQSLNDAKYAILDSTSILPLGNNTFVFSKCYGDGRIEINPIHFEIEEIDDV